MLRDWMDLASPCWRPMLKMVLIAVSLLAIAVCNALYWHTEGVLYGRGNSAAVCAAGDRLLC